MNTAIPVFPSSRAVPSAAAGTEDASSAEQGAASQTKRASQEPAPQLVVGIKRRVTRTTQTAIDAAQAALHNARETVLRNASHKCHYCGALSKSHAVDHLDGDHQNNSSDNLVCACHLCHAYHHLGQESLEALKPGLDQDMVGGNKQMILVRAPVNPGLSAQDFNHLLRAIAMALTNPEEAPAAKQVLLALVSPEVRREMQASFVSAWPSDVGLALSRLTDDEYRDSRYVLRDVRAIFSPEVLTIWGRAWVQEQPAFADPAQWAQLMSKTMAIVTQEDTEGVGVESVLDRGQEANQNPMQDNHAQHYARDTHHTDEQSDDDDHDD